MDRRTQTGGYSRSDILDMSKIWRVKICVKYSKRCSLSEGNVAEGLVAIRELAQLFVEGSILEWRFI